MAVRPAAVLALLAATSLGTTGCVLKKDYDKTVADAAQAKAQADADHKADQARVADLQQQLAQLQGELQDRDTRLNDLTTTSHNVQAQLDEATAINQQLRGELERLGKDADKLLAERGTLSKALDDAKNRRDELRKAQAAAEVRTQLFHDLAYRFKPLVDAGQLRIDNRRGELVVNVSGDLLFEPGHAEIRAVGKGVLMELAHALQQLPAPPAGQGPRRFLATSHVDDAPLKSKHYKSTWELTAARAAAAVEYLVSLGIPAQSLTAAGAGSFDPIVPNDSTDDRAKNRRLEIALLPSPPPPAAATAAPTAPTPPAAPTPSASAPATPAATKK
jgi:flagellar motor protein MotB